jgi:hypothetical protein
MLKFVILLACLVGIAQAGLLINRDGLIQRISGQRLSNEKSDVSDRISRMTQEQLQRQKFLLDVLYNLNEPIVGAESCRVSQFPGLDLNLYENGMEDDVLRRAVDLVRSNSLIGKNVQYDITDENQTEQLFLIYRLLVSARDWTTFQSNVEYLRGVLNNVLFVNAVVLSLRNRPDSEMFIIPALNEILPEYYYNEELVNKVRSLDLNNIMDSESTSTRPNYDYAGINRLADILGPQIGMQIMNKTKLWMPWRQMRMDMAMRKMDGEKPMMQYQKDNRVILPVETNRRPMGLLLDDVDFRSFVQNLLNDFIIQTETGRYVQPNEENDRIIPENRFYEQDRSIPMNRVNTDESVNVLPRVSLNRDQNNVEFGMGLGNLREVSADNDRLLYLNRRRLGGLQDTRFEENEPIRNRFVDDVGIRYRRDVSDMSYPGYYMRDGQENPRYDASLPTVDINNDRLLYINRRRMQPDVSPALNYGEIFQNSASQMENRKSFGYLADRDNSIAYEGRRNYEGIQGEASIYNPRRYNEDIPREASIYGPRRYYEDIPREPFVYGPRRYNEDIPREPSVYGPRRYYEDIPREPSNYDSSRYYEDIPREPSNYDSSRYYEDVPRRVAGYEPRSNVGYERQGEEQSKDRFVNKDQYGYGKDEYGMDYNSRKEPGRSKSMMKKQKGKSARRSSIGKEGPSRYDKSMNNQYADMRDEQKSFNDDVPRRMMFERPGGDYVRYQDFMENRPERMMYGKSNVGGRYPVEDRFAYYENREDARSPINMERMSDDAAMFESSRPRRLARYDDKLILEQLRGSEILLYNLQQITARINMERISYGLQDIADLLISPNENRFNNPRLPMEQRFALRLNDMRLRSLTSRVLLDKIRVIEDILQRIVQMNLKSQMMDVDSMIKDILIGRVGNVGVVSVLRDVLPQTNLNRFNRIGIELNDPIVQYILRRIVRIIDQQRENVLGAYPQEQLEEPGVTINYVEIDRLSTYVEAVDSDLVNLLDPKFNVLRQGQNLVVAREQRLNQKTFTIDYDISVASPERVIVRTFLGPKVDVAGRELNLEDIRRDFIMLDAVVADLNAGRNVIRRKSRDIAWTSRDTTPYTTIYQQVLNAMSSAPQARIVSTKTEVVGQRCRFPQRLLIPRGQPTGLQMQMLIIVSRINESDRLLNNLQVDDETICGLGLGSVALDSRPLGFPLDRPLENVDKFIAMSNVQMVDINIYHDDK